MTPRPSFSGIPVGNTPWLHWTLRAPPGMDDEKPVLAEGPSGCAMRSAGGVGLGFGIVRREGTGNFEIGRILHLNPKSESRIGPRTAEPIYDCPISDLRCRIRRFQNFLKTCPRIFQFIPTRCFVHAAICDLERLKGVDTACGLGKIPTPHRAVRRGRQCPAGTGSMQECEAWPAAGSFGPF